MHDYVIHERLDWMKQILKASKGGEQSCTFLVPYLQSGTSIGSSTTTTTATMPLWWLGQPLPPPLSTLESEASGR